MGHEMHMMEGFVLDSSTYGESGRILKILTKDHGVMSVVATGVRELKSKMRGSMSILQIVNFEYVEGREVNRLTGIHEVEKFEQIFIGGDVIAKRRVISNVVNFVLRTVVGDTKNERLWESFVLGVRQLGEISRDPRGSIARAETPGGLGNFEIIWLIKILVALGYWEEGRYDQFSDGNFEYLKVEENRKQIVEEINQSIKSTHL